MEVLSARNSRSSCVWFIRLRSRCARDRWRHLPPVRLGISPRRQQREGLRRHVRDPRADLGDHRRIHWRGAPDRGRQVVRIHGRALAPTLEEDRSVRRRHVGPRRAQVQRALPLPFPPPPRGGNGSFLFMV